MFAKCANYWCPASRHPEELSSMEFQFGERLGGGQTEVVCLWLCTRCCREMRPQVDASHAAEARTLHAVSGVNDPGADLSPSKLAATTAPHWCLTTESIRASTCRAPRWHP